MPLVSITRTRVRAAWFLPSFALATSAVIRQARHAEGFLGGSLLPDRRWTFWTMTLWDSTDAMRAFMAAGSHAKTMPKLAAWCDEASVVHWEQAEPIPPSWGVAEARMRDNGRASKVLTPSADHQAMSFAACRAGVGGSITPARRPPYSRD